MGRRVLGSSEGDVRSASERYRKNTPSRGSPSPARYSVGSIGRLFVIPLFLACDRGKSQSHLWSASFGHGLGLHRGQPSLLVLWELHRAIEWGSMVAEEQRDCPVGGHIQSADAAQHPLPDETANVWFTDPPYYDAVPYAHLADFFFVWLKRIGLADIPVSSGDPHLTPKDGEIVVDRPHRLSTSTKTPATYESGMVQPLPKVGACLRGTALGRLFLHTRQQKDGKRCFRGLLLVV